MKRWIDGLMARKDRDETLMEATYKERLELSRVLIRFLKLLLTRLGGPGRILDDEKYRGPEIRSVPRR
jgi:hypothetical protein